MAQILMDLAVRLAKTKTRGSNPMPSLQAGYASEGWRSSFAADQAHERLHHGLHVRVADAGE